MSVSSLFNGAVGVASHTVTSVAGHVDGHPNGLLAAHLLGVRLGARYPATLAAAGPVARHTLVFCALFALLAADASAVLPLATGLYLLTTTTWTLAERTVPHRSQQG